MATTTQPIRPPVPTNRCEWCGARLGAAARVEVHGGRAGRKIMHARPCATAMTVVRVATAERCGHEVAMAPNPDPAPATETPQPRAFGSYRYRDSNEPPGFSLRAAQSRSARRHGGCATWCLRSGSLRDAQSSTPTVPRLSHPIDPLEPPLGWQPLLLVGRTELSAEAPDGMLRCRLRSCPASGPNAAKAVVAGQAGPGSFSLISICGG